MAIAALVLGILTFVCLGPIAGVLAVIFGFLGLQKAKQVGTGRGMALAGIILGIIGTILTIVLFVLLVVVADNIDDAVGTADADDYDLVTESCEIDEFGFVTFEGTIENTAGRDMDFNIFTNIRDTDSDVIVADPSTLVSVPEGDTVRWSVVDSVPEGSSVECSVDSVDDFFN